MNTAEPERGPQSRAPALPKDATALAIAAIILCCAVIAGVWLVLAAIRQAFAAANAGSIVVDAGLGLVALLPLWLLLPATRGFIEARRAVVAQDSTSIRVHNAEARGWSWYALGYGLTIVIIAGLALFLVLNDSAVAKTFFRLDLIFGSFGLVFRGFMLNVAIFCIAEVLILIWGLVIAIARMIPGKAGQPIRFLAIAYTDIFRGLPSIITIYLVGFGLPLTGLTGPLETWLRQSFGIQDLTPVWAIIALTLTYGAYVAEVYRSGIESIHPSQMAAARSLGLSFTQTLRFVIVPQAIRRIIPPLLNDFIGLQKDTALINVIGAIDSFNQAKMLASIRFNLSTVTTVALLFVAITIPQARLVDYLLEAEAKRTRK
jgi:polar amino acid transport system permease protein